MSKFLIGASEVVGDAREIFLSFLNRFREIEKGGNDALYWEGESKTLRVGKTLSLHKEVKCYSIGLNSILNGNFVWIPDFTLFAEVDDNGVEHFYPCEYIDNALYLQKCCIEMNLDFSFEINKEECRRILHIFNVFMQSLKDNGYLFCKTSISSSG